MRWFRSLAFLFERHFQAVEACFPEIAVLGQPPVELAKRPGLEPVEPPLSVRPHGDKAGGVEDAQVTTYTGLVNPALATRSLTCCSPCRRACTMRRRVGSARA